MNFIMIFYSYFDDNKSMNGYDDSYRIISIENFDTNDILNLTKNEKEELTITRDAEIFKILVNDKDSDIRQSLAAFGGKIPEEVQEKLLKDNGPKVRLEIKIRLGFIPDIGELNSHDTFISFDEIYEKYNI